MPTLEDLPKVPSVAAATLALTDLIMIYDVSVQPNGVKTMTVTDFLKQAIDALPAYSGVAQYAIGNNSGVPTVKP